ncbi:MAG: ATP-binding cassette domain-containing protein, partial [Acidobacteriota bacterium]
MSVWLLEADGLSKRFGGVEALQEASFRIAPRTITAFLGENGAGKTTALKLILGFLKPDSGRVSLAAPGLGMSPNAPSFSPGLRAAKSSL